MKLRKIIFWLHLTAGVVAGTVILVMSVTGVLLAFERQIVAFAERDTRTVTPPTSDAPRLSLNALVAKARESSPRACPRGSPCRPTPRRPPWLISAASRRYSSTPIPARCEATGSRQRAIFSVW
jgi:uncharacterized iron-regulated membrane protein